MTLKPHQQAFIDFVIATEALRFGTFTLKSGRTSPYFFNTGLFNTGGSVARLGGFYADAIVDSGLKFDMMFGPAYKGIPLAVATVIALAQQHRVDVPFAFNRKEAKDHGEGGTIVGAPLRGRVLVIDDVISSGLSVGESVTMIRAAGATPAGVVIAMDRQERGKGAQSAVQEVRERYQIPVASVIALEQLVGYLEQQPEMADTLQAVRRYRTEFGVDI